jgi:hypothetical protein
VVHHSSKKANTVERWLLLSAIVIIALLDVAFTTYFSNDGEIGRSIQARIERPVTPPPAANDAPSTVEPETVNGETDIELSTAAVDEQEIQIRKMPVRASYTGPLRYRNRSAEKARYSTADKIIGPCRTINYPFVNASYYVRVTDDTGCLSSPLSRSKNVQLLASLVPTRNSTRR